jgi:hypothetical protein
MHQPHFLPSVQYMHRMARCDVFLYADNVQHQRHYWEHRNRVLLRGAPTMLSLSIVSTGAPQRLDEARLHEPERNVRRVCATLHHAYRRASGWPWVDTLCAFMSARAPGWASLAEANIDILEHLRDALRIDVPCGRWSAMPLDPDGAPADVWRSLRVARYAEAVGATHFLYGRGTASYLDPDHFRERGVALLADTWVPTPYPQRGGFVANLSVVDLLGEMGGRAREFLGEAP